MIYGDSKEKIENEEPNFPFSPGGICCKPAVFWYEEVLWLALRTLNPVIRVQISVGPALFFQFFNTFINFHMVTANSPTNRDSSAESLLARRS
jgi:hypothetical protein